MESLSISLMGVIIIIVCFLGVAVSLYILISVFRNKELVNPKPDSFLGRYAGYGVPLKIKLFVIGAGMLFGWLLVAWAIIFRT